MENQNLNILDEVNKGATMGMDAISYVSEKVVDNDFKEVLNTEYNKYKDISNRVNNLYDIDGINDLLGNIGIAHTRWATHGKPSKENSHPHMDNSNTFAVVHNGIIENYQELREKLQNKGYTFYSDTDTEVAIKLIDYYYKKYEHTPVDAINHAMVRIRGSYALAVMFKDYPEEIYAARKDSPMIIGVADGESFVASDVPAILKYTRSVYYIGNMEMCRLQKGNVTFYNLDGDEIEKDLVEIQWDAEAAEKAGSGEQQRAGEKGTLFLGKTGIKRPEQIVRDRIETEQDIELWTRTRSYSAAPTPMRRNIILTKNNLR